MAKALLQRNFKNKRISNALEDINAHFLATSPVLLASIKKDLLDILELKDSFSDHATLKKYLFKLLHQLTTYVHYRLILDEPSTETWKKQNLSLLHYLQKLVNEYHVIFSASQIEISPAKIKNLLKNISDCLSVENLKKVADDTSIQQTTYYDELVPAEVTELIHEENSSGSKIYWIKKEVPLPTDPVSHKLQQAGFTFWHFDFNNVEQCKLSFDDTPSKPVALFISLEEEDFDSAFWKTLPEKLKIRDLKWAQLPIVLLYEGKMLIPHLDSSDVPPDYKQLSEANSLKIHNLRQKAIEHLGSSFFIDPQDVDFYLKHLGEIVRHSSHWRETRVLILMEDDMLESFHEMILKAVGIQTARVQSQQELTEVIINFRPHALLTGLFHEEKSSLELSAFLRQQELPDHVPVFIATPGINIDGPLALMNLGYDTTIESSGDISGFLFSLWNRLVCTKTNSSKLLKDSLTFLSDHYYFENQLTIEFARAKRNLYSMVCAFVDIDNLSQINTEFGYRVGNQILKECVRLFSSRLRITDVITRYHDDQLAILLNNSSAYDAEQILVRLCRDFTKFAQAHVSGQLSPSISCGFAVSTKYRDVTSITTAAQKGLDHAKKAGGNRVVLAD